MSRKSTTLLKSLILGLPGGYLGFVLAQDAVASPAEPLSAPEVLPALEILPYVLGSLIAIIVTRLTYRLMRPAFSAHSRGGVPDEL